VARFGWSRSFGINRLSFRSSAISATTMTLILRRHHQQRIPKRVAIAGQSLQKRNQPVILLGCTVLVFSASSRFEFMVPEGSCKPLCRKRHPAE
jgi:hypothetical protein